MKALMTFLFLAVAIGAAGFASRDDWRLLRDWGLLSRKTLQLPEEPYFEPMGISYQIALVGFERTFKMEERTDYLVKRPQPRFFGSDEESLASLEIRGEKKNIGLAALSVSMPRVMISRENLHTQQTISINLMKTFLRNTVPGTYPGGWLDGMIAAYNRGDDISMVKVGSGRKVVIRVDPRMRDTIRLVVTKAGSS